MNGARTICCIRARPAFDRIVLATRSWLLPADAGDLLRGTIEKRYAPVGVHGEHTVRHRIEQLVVKRFLHLDAECESAIASSAFDSAFAMAFCHVRL